MRLYTTIAISELTEDDITIKEEDAIEQISMSLGDIVFWFNTRDDLDLVRNKIEEYLSQPLCELCDNGKLATTIQSDELGNDLHVCDDHAEQLAARTPERQADEWYDQTHKSGD
jgi:hypothetical protein